MSLRHVLWNFFGLAFPLLVAVLVIPKLLILIGAERFGLLALAWGAIGYASLFDLGIGRAVTQKISILRATDKLEDASAVLATGVSLTLWVSLIAMAIIILADIMGAYTIFATYTVPEGEVKNSILLLALALPLQAISATYRGVNEAYLNFKSISVVRVVLGVVNFLGPFLIAIFSNDVSCLISSLVLSRGLALWFYRKGAYQCLYGFDKRVRGQYSAKVARQLIGFGGWVSITSIVGPILVQSDRFFIGALISATAVTVYVIPYEVTVQALIGVGAVTSVAFPVIAKMLTTDPQAAKELFRIWLFRVVVAMLLGMSLIAVILPNLLELWLKQPVNDESVLVGRILAVGVVLNAVGSMYFALLHAKGYSKPTAILHLVEMPIYFILLVNLIPIFGVVGCAIAWSLRNLLDTFGLIIMGHKLVLNR
ncbi:MAG: oligosaccharide flippase family protein [Methylomonas sp.]|nr:oligosaccharide flippase family protein [Methylomonas sp.]